MSDLSILNNSNVPKPNHGSCKFLEKQTLIPRKSFHNPTGPVITQQGLIRREHAFPLDHSSVVIIVENRGRGVQELTRIGIGDGFGALSLQVGSELGVEGRVSIVGGAKVAEARLEGGAVGEAECVAAGKCDQVFGGKTSPRKALDELRCIGRRSWQVYGLVCS